MIEKLGPYRIVRVLGRGGMGTVYEGVHVETDERAAIKVLSQTLAADGNFSQRFLAEIEALKQLKHQNIVELYGDGEEDGLLFYAMEFVEGQSLQQELQAGRRFDWRDVTKIAIEICNALRHGHDHGIIHRDLKPANLLRSTEGQIKLADFGIAKSFRMTDLTADGSVVGTADYMAPEQAEGRPVNNRTDLYSLGTVMFTLLTRRTPFSGSSIPQVLHKLRYEAPPSIRKLAPSVPTELAQIIEQLLEKEPDNRIPTALVLANRLKAMEHGLAAGTVVDSAEQIDDRGPSVSDQATRVSGVDEGPPTEVSPTAVDEGANERESPYSWNDATVVTSESNADAGREVAADANTVVDQPAPSRRFTTLEEDERQREEADTADWTGHLSTIAIGLTLVLLVGGIYYALQPPSAEKLFDRIGEVVEGGEVKDAKTDIELFLDLYATHEQAPTVRDWQLDIQSEYLFSRLRNRDKKHALTPIQAAFVAAMKLREEQPKTAYFLFQRLLDQRKNDPDEQDPITCVEASQHQLKRLAATVPAEELATPAEESGGQTSEAATPGD